MFRTAPYGLALLLMLASLGARAEELITMRSAATVAATIDRLQAAATAAGFFVAARVDHAKAAEAVGIPLRPSVALIFGNPKGGSPLMQCDQRVGLNLPLRALAWQDEAGQVWLATTDPVTLKAKFGLTDGCDAPLAAVRAGVTRLLEAATKP